MDRRFTAHQSKKRLPSVDEWSTLLELPNEQLVNLIHVPQGQGEVWCWTKDTGSLDATVVLAVSPDPVEPQITEKPFGLFLWVYLVSGELSPSKMTDEPKQRFSVSPCGSYLYDHVYQLCWERSPLPEKLTWLDANQQWNYPKENAA